MVTVVNRAPHWSEALSTGLGQGLNQLTQQKLYEMQLQRQAQGLAKLFGNQLPPEQVQALGMLSPEMQQQYLKQQLQAPSQAAFSNALSSLLQPEGSEQQGITGPLTERQSLELAKLGMQKQQQSNKEIAARFKESKAERKEILDKARAAQQNLNDLDRMEELEKEGKLDTPGYTEGLKRAGFDIPALMNPGSEEFQKIAANFMRDAKTYFGGRVSNYEIEQFLKTIPSLSQSPEGRKRVIANLKRIARMDLAYKNAYKEVMAENKGIPPQDLLEQIDDKIDKLSESVSKQFKADLEKSVPKGQNRLITGLQAALGQTIGSAPGIVAGGVLGGAVGGIPGAAIGAALGPKALKLF